jgi:subtilisin family serine protease
MLEIVHDLAPEAQLYFATAWKSAAGFANNIKRLADAGCKVIVDDVGYLDESPFQDDIITQAVNAATARGVLYFSAAGNSGNLNDGTSGAWEGDYRAMPSQVQGYQTMHDFGGGDWANRILFDGTGCYTLFWSDPLNGSANDYDLFLVDPTLSSIEGWSDEIQDGSQDPFEGFCALPGVDLTNYHILVAKYQGEDRFLHLSANRGEFERATDGQISGHPAAQNAFAVSAVSAANRTIPFVGNERVETFTSDGPRRVFYYPNGTPITPGNFSATGGMVREKPDIAAADGVRTLTPGFNPFYGTSAAAPHAAAIGALMLSGRPGLTLTDVRNAFRKSALDIEAPGDWDRDSGYGIIRADLVLQETGPFARLSPGIINYLLRD